MEDWARALGCKASGLQDSGFGGGFGLRCCNRVLSTVLIIVLPNRETQHSTI